MPRQGADALAQTNDPQLLLFMIPTSLDRLLCQRRTLMLQGPMGPFFERLARTLRAHGQQVWKVNFNAGDELVLPR
jgi:capsular polysaccharide export protein